MLRAENWVWGLWRTPLRTGRLPTQSLARSPRSPAWRGRSWTKLPTADSQAQAIYNLLDEVHSVDYRAGRRELFREVVTQLQRIINGL